MAVGVAEGREAPGLSANARRLLAARALRGFGDGFVSVYLAAYLTRLGHSPWEISVLLTAMLLGSAALTLTSGALAHRFAPRRMLLAASALMLATGAGFSLVTDFWPLVLVAFTGTLNPSAGDVTVFLPTEQALLATEASARQRTSLFALYNLGGALLGALGALASGLPEQLAARFGWEPIAAYRAGFALYGALALVLVGLYAGLRDRVHPTAIVPPAPLAGSRAIVLRLSALFSLDSFGSGLVVQSLLALWLYQRFGLSVQTAAGIFFAANTLNAFSQLLSPRIAARIGLVETMAFTHLPANALLALAAFMPTAPLAVACLLLRTVFSQMDVPARQSYVMSVVPPEERAAAASATNAPRSLAAALSPLLAGALLEHSTFGWPLLLAGGLKIAYDLLLLAGFRGHRPQS